MTTADPEVPARQHGYETRDVSPRGVIWALCGLLGGIAVAGTFVALLFLLFTHLEPPHSPPPLARRTLEPAAPRLQLAPAADRATLEAASKRLLHGLAWTDPVRGRVRVPIERAMALLAAHGWPDPEDMLQ